MPNGPSFVMENLRASGNVVGVELPGARWVGQVVDAARYAAEGELLGKVDHRYDQALVREVDRDAEVDLGVHQERAVDHRRVQQAGSRRQGLDGGSGHEGQVGSPATTDDNYSNEMGRLDYNLSDKDRMFFDVRIAAETQSKNEYFNNVAEGSLLYRNPIGGSFDNVYVVNSTTVADVRINFSRLAERHGLPSEGFDS